MNALVLYMQLNKVKSIKNFELHTVFEASLWQLCNKNMHDGHWLQLKTIKVTMTLTVPYCKLQCDGRWWDILLQETAALEVPATEVENGCLNVKIFQIFILKQP